MNSFPIYGVTLPSDFTADTVADVDSEGINCPNEKLTLNELIEHFSPNTLHGVEIHKNVKKSFDRYKNNNKYSFTNGMIENYDYFVCPITNLNVFGFDIPYFKRLGISSDRFLELLPMYSDCYQYAPSKKLREKLKREETEKEKAKINSVSKLGDITFNGHNFDLDHYHKHYKRKLGKHIKERRKNKIPDDEWILNYAYFECPLTSLPILQMASKAHLAALNITEEEFKIIFPDIALDIKQTPRSCGISLKDFNNGVIRKEQKTYKSSEFPEEFEHRYMHITDMTEYLTVVNDDEYVMQYKIQRSRISKEIERKHPNAVSGVDYCICPVFGHKYYKFNRTSLKYYGITWERFIEWFGDVFTQTAESHRSTISDSLKEVTEDGRTVHQKAADKAKITKNTVGEDGLTINQRTAIATKHSHLTNLDEYGRNGYQQQADNTHEDRMRTRYGDTIKQYDRRERYERIIELMTNRCRVFYNYAGDNNIVWSTYRDNNDPDGMQLDHKFSRYEGYHQKISPVCIGNFHNIEYMKAHDNFKKKNACSITPQELATINHMTVKDMEYEFEKIMSIIDYDIENDIMHNSMNVLIRSGHHIALKIRPYNLLKHTCDDKEMDNKTKDALLNDIITNI